MPYTVNVPLPGQILMKEVSSTVKPTSVSVMTGQKRDYFIESNKGLNLIFSPLLFSQHFQLLLLKPEQWVATFFAL